MTGQSQLSILPPILALAACGGGGGGEIASAPPPVAAPAQPTIVSIALSSSMIASPATRQGTSETIALIERSGSAGQSSYRLAAPSEVRITTYQPGPLQSDVSYTLAFASPELPDNMSTLKSVIKEISVGELPIIPSPYTTREYFARFGEEIKSTVRYSDGTQVVSGGSHATGFSTSSESIGPNKEFRLNSVNDVGLSHVSFGAWAWRSVTILPGGGDDYVGGAVYFVYGDRTPAAEIPVTGIARYSAQSLGYRADVNDAEFPSSRNPVRIALMADFGQRSISAVLTRDHHENCCDLGSLFDVVLGLEVHGTGTIGAPGVFSVPLNGNVISPINLQQTASIPVAGVLDGAFFGSKAEQVGGVFAVGETLGVPLVRDAFVGTRD